MFLWSSMVLESTMHNDFMHSDSKSFLCSILRIPVSMHNIEDKDIFRPAAWNAFGMDKEGADYRACANFGPIYK